MREKVESTKKILSEFVNISLASSKIKSIKIKQENGVYNLRPNINILIYGAISSTKSTLLNTIAKETNSKDPYTDISYPALIGSIDSQTKQLMIGASWECRNRLLILDEFNFSNRNKELIRVILQLIEGGQYNKKLASFSSPSKNEDEDLFYMFKDGEFNIKTRFSLILATMKYIYNSQSYELKALASRCICIPYYPSQEELLEIAQGYPIFTRQDKITDENIIIDIEDYNFILKYVNSNSRHQNFLRIVGDCCRVFAVEGKHREDLYDLIIKYGTKEFQLKENFRDD